MSYSDVTLIDYIDNPIVDTTPISVNIISELRWNTQSILTALDIHYGKRTAAAHGDVTATESGFMTPTLLELLDAYSQELQEYEDILYADDFPTYGIAIWRGDRDSIPSGWAVCDGTNDTPDLRDRFVLNWNTSKYTVNSIGGSEYATVTAANVLASHTHSYLNCFFTSWGVGPYTQFTKYGQVYATFGDYDWDNRIYGINDTTGAAGSSSTSYTINIIPAYVSKMFIMKMPASSTPEYTYRNIIVLKPALGTIVTSATGKVRDGSRITISVNPNPGCRVKKVLVNGEAISNNTVMYVYKDLTISAECERIPYTETYFYAPANILGTTDLNFSFVVPNDVYKIKVAGVGPANYATTTNWDNSYRGNTDPYNKGAKDTVFGSLVARRGLSAYPPQPGEAEDTLPAQSNNTLGGWDQAWTPTKTPTGSFGGSNGSGGKWCWGRCNVQEMVVKPGMVISGRAAAPMKIDTNFRDNLYTGYIWIAYGGDIIEENIDTSKIVVPGTELVENSQSNVKVVNKPIEATKVKITVYPSSTNVSYNLYVNDTQVNTGTGDNTWIVSVNTNSTVQIYTPITSSDKTQSIRTQVSWSYEINTSQ